MAEMNVSMRLTLENLASGPLAAFIDQVKSLEPALAALNGKFATFSRSAKSLGDSAASAAGGTSKLEGALSALGDRLAAFEAKLGATVDGFAQFGLNAREAASATMAASAAIGAATDKMDGAAASAANAKREMNGMATALKGMAEIWAGLKLEHGLKASVKSASDFATQVAQLRSLGLNGDQIKYAQQQAWRATAQTPYVSAADALAARRAIIAGTGQNNEVLMNAALPQLLRNAYAYKNLLGSKASIADIIGNFAGLAEARGMSQSAAGLSAASNEALQVSLATQGRMKLSQQEMVARQYKYGGAQLVDAPGYARIMALAEQYTLAGHEGGGGGGGRGVSQVGTALGMVLKTMLGGKMNKVTEELLTQMGMFEPGAKLGSTATTSTNTFGVLRGTTLGEKDPLKWVHDVLVPRMLAYAIKNASTYFPHGGEHDASTQKLALDRLAVQMFGPTGGVNVSNMVAMASNPAVYSRLENTVGLASKAKTGQAAVNETNQYTKAVAQFGAAMTNLKIALGSGLLPMLTPIIDAFAGMARGIGEVLHAMPALSAAIATFGAALGVVLTIKGFSKLFGSLSSVLGVFKKIGPTSSVAAAESETAATGMASVWDARLAAMAAMAARFAGIVGAAFLLYEAGENVQIAGVTINNHIRMLLVAAMGQFDRFFTWVSNGLNNMSAGVWEGVQSVASKVGLSSVANYAGGKVALFKGRVAESNAAFAASDKIRTDMFSYYMSPQAQPGYMRAAHGAPDTEALTQAAQDAAAQVLTPGMGGLPSLGGKKAKGHKPVDIQALAQQWGLQDMHRANTEAGKQLAADNKPILEARNAIAGYGKKSDPAAAWYQRASQLAASSNPADQALAAHAQQIGDAIQQQEALKTAKAHFADLQKQLAETTKLNAAQVTAGVLTPDQAQAATLQAQRQAQPGLMQAAQAVQALTPAGTAAATAIQATITKLQELGTGLTQFQQKLYNGAQNALAGLFDGLMQGKMTFRREMAKFVQSLANSFTSSLSQQLAQGLMNGMFKSGTPGGSGLRALGGIAPIGQAIGGGISSLFAGFMSSNNGTGAYTSGGQAFNNPSAYTAGGTGVSTGGFGSSLGGLFGSIIGSLAGFATGADNIPNDMVAQIHKGEMIIPAKGADAIRSGKLGGSSFNGDVNVVVQHNGNASVSTSNPSMAHQAFGQMIGEQVRQTILQEQRPGGLLNGGA